MRRDSWQGFGRPDTLIYYGRGRQPVPAAEGVQVRVERQGFNGMTLVALEGGQVVDSMGGTAKFWAVVDEVESS